MILLYRNKKDAFADKIASRLEDLVVAHKTVIADNDNSTSHSLPYLKEGDTIIDEKDQIQTFLDELSSELNQQRSISGDACYIDPETGTVC